VPGPLPSSMSPMVAAVIFGSVTASMLLLTLMWALANRRPAKARPHLVGRRATVYRYSPTRLQDERGTPLPANRTPKNTTAPGPSN